MTGANAVIDLVSPSFWLPKSLVMYQIENVVQQTTNLRIIH